MFSLCRAVLCCAVLCSKTTHMGIESHDGSVALAHKALGSVAFALLLLQVGALVAPAGLQSNLNLQIAACILPRV
jgi:hypothetical protein